MRRMGGRARVTVALVVCVAMAALAGSASATTSAATSLAGAGAGPGLGPNVIVFNPSMPQATIQATLDAISAQQVPNQFGSQRYAVFFEPGTYGSAADPLDFQVGYYTQVAGLGAQPGDTVINGAINVFNQCSGGECTGLNNFWRSVSNLTINVHLPSATPAYAPDPGDQYGAGCDNSNDMWAVSQAAPMRRVIVNGTLSLFDYCNQNFNYTSGGFFADDEFNNAPGQTGAVVINGSQQQFLTRNSNIDTWTNGVWHPVFLGDNGAPATDFAPPNQYTNVPTTPVSQEEPFLYSDGNGGYDVFVPAVRRDSVGPDYAGGPAAGRSLPIHSFFIAQPSTPEWQINLALALGRNLILTPGVYDLSSPIQVTHPGTVVLGLGFPTLIPQNGTAALRTAAAPGIKLSGIIVDAGPRNSRALVVVGSHRWGQGWSRADAADPTLLQDVFFRIGGAEAGRATNSLVVNSDDTILDDVWAWRADHGAGAGWTTNPAATGVIVNGDNVDAYGLAVEHYQRYEVIWNGQNGEDVFFQNEMPYDPPSQAAWMASPTTDGYPAFLLTPRVRSFQGYGMGSYSFFDQGVPIRATEAFASPDTPGDQFHDLLTVFLNGSGGIDSVINGVGGSATAANQGTPVDVVSYP